MEIANRLASLTLARNREDLHHELLIAELQHRIRNLFSSVGAVVYSTLRTYANPKEFQKVFEGRLSALARAHSLAFKSSDMALRALLIDMLAPYGMQSRIKMTGPRFTLSPEAAVVFSLATHELATNAAKYGSFANAQGTLDVTWDVLRDGRGEHKFELVWEERGGPVVVPPPKSGFGRFAIEKSLASTVDGTVAMDFAPTGLVCRISAPISPRLGTYAH